MKNTSYKEDVLIPSFIDGQFRAHGCTNCNCDLLGIPQQKNAQSPRLKCPSG